MPDPYTTLGVARDASADDIRRAYRKLAKTHHPDLNPGDAEAEAIFKRVSAAHQLLADPETRGRFDRGEIDAEGNEAPPRPRYRDYAQADSAGRYGPGGAGAGAGNWTASDFESMFGTMFNDPGSAGFRPGAGRGGSRGPMKGADAQFSLAVGFLDAINGTTTRLTLPEGGTLDVRIPPATEDGTILRLRGKGRPGQGGGPAGDALIAVQVSPHRFFRREGRDIRLDLPVSVAEAVLGGPVEVPTPGGAVRMRIPAGSDRGAVLRLRGRGVPGHGDVPAGDLYATLNIVIGPADPAFEAFLRDWKPAPFDPRAGMEVE